MLTEGQRKEIVRYAEQCGCKCTVKDFHSCVVEDTIDITEKMMLESLSERFHAEKEGEKILEKAKQQERARILKEIDNLSEVVWMTEEECPRCKMQRLMKEVKNEY